MGQAWCIYRATQEGIANGDCFILTLDMSKMAYIIKNITKKDS
jgi:hypothetical protein